MQGRPTTLTALNRYTQVGSATYGYDADGNLISIVNGPSSTAFTFDDENLLTAAQAADSRTSYEYNALDHRVAAVVDGTRTAFLNDPTGFLDVVAEFDGSGVATARYVHGLGLTSRMDAAGTPYFYDFDGTGSTTGLTGPAGTYVNQYDYLPFGAQAGVTESIGNQFRFVGQFGVMHEGNGLDYMRARYYAAGARNHQHNGFHGILDGQRRRRRICWRRDRHVRCVRRR